MEGAEIIRRPRTGLMRGAKAPTVYWDVLGLVGRFFSLDLYILLMYILYYIYLSIYLSVYLSICLCKYLYIDYLFPSTCLLSTHLPFITLGTFYLRCRQIGVFSVRWECMGQSEHLLSREFALSPSHLLARNNFLDAQELVRARRVRGLIFIDSTYCFWFLPAAVSLMMVLFLCGAIGFLGYKVCLQDTDEFEEMDELTQQGGDSRLFASPRWLGGLAFAVQRWHLLHSGDM